MFAKLRKDGKHPCFVTESDRDLKEVCQPPPRGLVAGLCPLPHQPPFLPPLQCVISESMKKGIQLPDDYFRYFNLRNEFSKKHPDAGLDKGG